MKNVLINLSVVMVAILLWMPHTATAKQTGISGESGNPNVNSGRFCIQCHGGGITPTVTMTGDQNLTTGATGNYQVKNCGGQNNHAGLGVSNVGFPPPSQGTKAQNLGFFTAIDATTQVLAGDLTHTEPRADVLEPDGVTMCATFDFQWTAPLYSASDLPITITLYTASNSVNFNQSTSGDMPNRANLAVNVNAGSNPAPVANPGGPYSGVEGSPVTVDGSGSTDSNGTVVSYTWNFGDTTPPVTTGLPTQDHTYFNAGTYTISLTVIDNEGSISDSATTTANIVTTNDLAPVADATAGEPYQADVFGNIVFDGSLSSDDRGTILFYSWVFGDGTTGSDSVPTFTKAYTAQGTYSVGLTVMDTAFQTGKTTTVATVLPPDLPPTANVGGPYIGEPQVAMTFDGSRSTDDRGIASYLWDFDKLGALGLPGTYTATGAKPTFSYPQGGDYQVYLEVTDTIGQVGWAFTTATIGIIPVPPNVVLSFPGGQQGLVDTPMSMSAAGTTDDIDPITALNFEWDVDYDALTGTFLPDYTGTGLDAITHTYIAGGSYDIRVDVTDTEGLTGSAQNAVSVLSGATPLLGKFKIFKNVSPGETKDVSRNFTLDGSVIGGVVGQGYPGTLYVESVLREQRATTSGINDPKCQGGPVSIPVTVLGDDGTGLNITNFGIPFNYTICDTDPAAPFNGWIELDNGSVAPPQVQLSSVNGDAIPRVHAGGPYAGSAGIAVNFDASMTADWNGQANIVSFSWDFGDGSPVLTVDPNVDPTIIVPSHVYAAGSYTATLTVTDFEGNSASDTAAVTIN